MNSLVMALLGTVFDLLRSSIFAAPETEAGIKANLNISDYM